MIILSNLSEIPSFGSAPIYTTSVSAGFPSPADDYLEKNLNLDEFLIHHPAATFFARVQGEAMKAEGIFEGDYLVVDRSLTPNQTSLVLAVVNDEITIKRLPSPQTQTLEIWGVITAVVRKLS